MQSRHGPQPLGCRAASAAGADGRDARGHGQHPRRRRRHRPRRPHRLHERSGRGTRPGRRSRRHRAAFEFGVRVRRRRAPGAPDESRRARARDRLAAVAATLTRHLGPRRRQRDSARSQRSAAAPRGRRHRRRRPHIPGRYGAPGGRGGRPSAPGCGAGREGVAFTGPRQHCGRGLLCGRAGTLYLRESRGPVRVRSRLGRGAQGRRRHSRSHGPEAGRQPAPHGGGAAASRPPRRDRPRRGADRLDAPQRRDASPPGQRRPRARCGRHDRRLGLGRAGHHRAQARGGSRARNRPAQGRFSRDLVA